MSCVTCTRYLPVRHKSKSKYYVGFCRKLMDDLSDKSFDLGRLSQEEVDQSPDRCPGREDSDA